MDYKFRIGFMVKSKTNSVWTGPMIVTEMPPQYSHQDIYTCIHPKLGIGGFDETELELIGELTKLEKLIYGL